LVQAMRIKLKDGPREVRHSLPPQFKEKIKKLMSSQIDILHWMSRAALEMIGQSGFGYSFDSLEEDAKPHPFSLALKAFGWELIFASACTN
ncbi:hypothetical protein H0H93_003593, partial [Arthromyces matolae]